MKVDKSVIVTRRDIRRQRSREIDRENQYKETTGVQNIVLYRPDYVDKAKTPKEIGCQCEKRNNLTNFRSVNEIKIEESGNTVSSYIVGKNSAEVKIGRVRIIRRKRVRKIYLPEIQHQAVGSFNLHISKRKKKISKCIGPIFECTTGNTSKEENNTPNECTTIYTKMLGPIALRDNSQYQDKFKTKDEPAITNIMKNKNFDVIKSNNSSISVVTNVHDFMADENIIVDKLREIGSTKSVISDVKAVKELKSCLKVKYNQIQDNQQLLPDFKSTSTLRRRFEAFKRGLSKKDQKKLKDFDTAINSPKFVDTLQKLPSLTKELGNEQSKNPSEQTLSDAKNSHDNCPNNLPPSYSSQIEKPVGFDDIDNPDAYFNEGVKGMFKLWNKRFDFEDGSFKNINVSSSYDVRRNMSIEEIEKQEDNLEDEKPQEKPQKKQRKFFFFRFNKKNKNKSFNKEQTVVGCCQLKNGISMKVDPCSAINLPSQSPKAKAVKKGYKENSLARNWIEYLQDKDLNTAKSVHIRWNNNLYRKSSSTIFQLMNNIYADTDISFKSKSKESIPSFCRKTTTKPRVNFVNQNIEAWLVQKAFVGPKHFLKATKNNKSEQMNRGQNLEIKVSNKKWFIEKSKAFSHKIEVVLHSKNLVKVQSQQNSDEYLKIDIPKGFFTESSSDDMKNDESDERVFNIVDYDVTTNDIDVQTKTEKNTHSFIIGDHESNDIKVTVSVKDSKNDESKILETIIKRPPAHRDVIIQGSNVYLPKQCDVIGVGIISHRDTDMVRKPILKSYKGDSDDSQFSLKRIENKCSFADSYLQEYYKQWMPGSTEFYSWCVSDSHIKCCNDNSEQDDISDQDESRSCPNITNEYQNSAELISSNLYGVPSCLPCAADVPKSTGNKGQNHTNFFKKLKSWTISRSATEDPIRVNAKDSLEVYKRRQANALIKMQDKPCCDKPCGIPPPRNECENQHKKKTNKKKVVLLDDKPCQKPSGILNFKGSTNNIKPCCADISNQVTPCKMSEQSVPPRGKRPLTPIIKSSLNCGVNTERISPREMCSKASDQCLDKNPSNDSRLPNNIILIKVQKNVAECETKTPNNRTNTMKPAQGKQENYNSPQIIRTNPKTQISTEYCNKPECPSRTKRKSDACGSPNTNQASGSKLEKCPSAESRNADNCESSNRPGQGQPSNESLCNRPQCPSRAAAKNNTQQNRCNNPSNESSAQSSNNSVCTNPNCTSKLKSPQNMPKSPCESPKNKRQQKQPLPRKKKKAKEESSSDSACNNPKCESATVLKKVKKKKDPLKKDKPSDENLCKKRQCPKPKTKSPNNETLCEPSEESLVPQKKTQCNKPLVPCKISSCKANVRSKEKTNCEFPWPLNSTSSNEDMQRKYQFTPPCSPPKCGIEKIRNDCGEMREPSIQLNRRNSICGSPKQNAQDISNPNVCNKCSNKPPPVCAKVSPIRFETSNICSPDCPNKPKPKQKEICGFSGIKLSKAPSKPKSSVSKENKCQKCCSSTTVIQTACESQMLKDYSVIKLNSKENLSVRLKKETPSTEEIREAQKINVRSVCKANVAPYYEKEHEPSVLNDVYKDSVNQVSSTHKINLAENYKNNELSEHSDSIDNEPHIVEINFKIKVTQGDKTTELNIGHDGDKHQEKSIRYRNENKKCPQEIYIFKDSKQSINRDNDLNIKIIIQNHKNKTKLDVNNSKTKQVTMADFAQKISKKFRTISTGESNLVYTDKETIQDDLYAVIDPTAFSVHRATIDLSSSVDKSEGRDVSSTDVSTAPTRTTLSSKTSQEPLTAGSATEMSVTDFADLDVKNKGTTKRVTDLINKKLCEQEIIEVDEACKTTSASSADQINPIESSNNLTTDEENSKFIPVVSNKSHATRREKKDALKQLFDKTGNQKYTRENVAEFRNKLKTILTSSSSNAVVPDITSKDLVKGMANTDDRDTSSTNDEAKCKYFPTRDSNNSVDRSSYCSEHEEPNINSGCLCNTLAARLNANKQYLDESKPACCCRKTTIDKSLKDNAASCDLRTELDYSMLNLKTTFKEVQTQNSVQTASQTQRSSPTKLSTDEHDFNAQEIEILKSVLDRVTQKKENINSTETRYFKVQNEPKRHVNECTMKKLNRRPMLGLTSDDKIIIINENVTDNLSMETRFFEEVRRSEQKQDSRSSKNNVIKKTAEILQSYETKKAVLQLYTERTTSDDHFIAKLPKFVYNSDSIEENYDVGETSTTQKSYSGNYFKRNIVMMSIKR